MIDAARGDLLEDVLDGVEVEQLDARTEVAHGGEMAEAAGRSEESDFERAQGAFGFRQDDSGVSCSTETSTRLDLTFVADTRD